MVVFKTKYYGFNGVHMKKIKRTLVSSVALIFLVSGCAAQKNWGASGGSKADGTVKLAYTYSMFEIPKVDDAEALKIATQRCKSWGYSSAIPFDFVNSQCQQMTTSGCSQTIVTKEFQCQ